MYAFSDYDSDESSSSEEDGSYARCIRQSDHAKRLYESYLNKDVLSLKLFRSHPLPLEGGFMSVKENR